MKPFKKIAILFCVVAGIICFWLMPGINKATDTSYTRLYEDTDHTYLPGDTTKKRARLKVVEARPIKYKRERIKPADGMKEVKAEMFSRAIHFRPEDKIVLNDSIVKIVKLDTAKSIR